MFLFVQFWGAALCVRVHVPIIAVLGCSFVCEGASSCYCSSGIKRLLHVHVCAVPGRNFVHEGVQSEAGQTVV